MAPPKKTISGQGQRSDWARDLEHGLHATMASFAWLSVIVKSGLQVIHPRTIVKCNLDDRFCSLIACQTKI